MGDISTGTLASALEALNKELPLLEEEQKRVVEERKKLDEQRKLLDKKIRQVSDGIKELTALFQGEIRESDQMPDESHPQPSSTSGSKAQSLDRRPEYAMMSIVQAIKKVMEDQARNYSTDDLSRLFYVIETPEHLEKAKRTVSSELSRGVKQGFWRKIGKNTYGPLLDDNSENTDQEHRELSEGLPNQQVEELVNSAVQVMKQLDEPMTPFHINTIVQALEDKGWKIGEKEKAILIDGLTQLSEEENSGIYAGADDDTFGIDEQPQEDEEENDIENESATPEGDASENTGGLADR